MLPSLHKLSLQQPGATTGVGPGNQGCRLQREPDPPPFGYGAEGAKRAALKAGDAVVLDTTLYLPNPVGGSTGPSGSTIYYDEVQLWTERWLIWRVYFINTTEKGMHKTLAKSYLAKLSGEVWWFDELASAFDMMNVALPRARGLMGNAYNALAAAVETSADAEEAYKATPESEALDKERHASRQRLTEAVAYFRNMLQIVKTALASVGLGTDYPLAEIAVTMGAIDRLEKLPSSSHDLEKAISAMRSAPFHLLELHQRDPAELPEKANLTELPAALAVTRTAIDELIAWVRSAVNNEVGAEEKLSLKAAEAKLAILDVARVDRARTTAAFPADR